ncbi:MAG: SUMF1/EgtB/PvdO family nonheme iron enzyme, partial [Planctomycetales bacterium]|nr:SUMF1/EgtB/PvdO family nonheme iron enzyme [Planctomycetales bacterium]
MNSLDAKRQIDHMCDEFECLVRSGLDASLEHSVDASPEPLRQALLEELLFIEVHYRHKRGEVISWQDYVHRFPQHTATVEMVRREVEWNHAHLGPHASRALTARCPDCRQTIELNADEPQAAMTCGNCGTTFHILSPQDDSPDDPPPQLAGHFELQEKIGAGAFATVWKAYDTILGRDVAIKIPRQGLMRSQGIRDRSHQEQFLREARLAAQLRHPNIVSVHEVGRDGDLLYIVSDLVTGMNLSDWLKSHRPTFAEATTLCAKIADALHHAHQAGVVHRDLKPSNVVMDAFDQPHLTDFGMARKDVGELTLTAEGDLMGTPTHMSPEQARGEAHSAGFSTDVYSLGVVLYQLLTGELPFRGNVEMLLYQVLHSAAPSPRSLNNRVPRDLETICLKCLEKQPRDRYASAGEVAKELRRFLDGRPIQARPVSRITRTWRWANRNPWATAFIAMCAAAVPLGLLLTWHIRNSAKAARAEALVDTLTRATASEIPELVRELQDYRQWADPLLLVKNHDAAENSREKLHTSLALLETDWADTPYVRDALLRCQPDEFHVLLDFLATGALDERALTQWLWDQAGSARLPSSARFRAACALAQLVPDDHQWPHIAEFVVDTLLRENTLFVGTWAEALYPARRSLTPRLFALYEQADTPQELRVLATNILAEFVKESPTDLARLVPSVDTRQFLHVHEVVAARRSEVTPLIRANLSKRMHDLQTPGLPDTVAKQAAHNAVMLLRLRDNSFVWQRLRSEHDPRVRYYLTHLFKPCGVPSEQIVAQAQRETNTLLRNCLVTGLGDYDLDASPSLRDSGALPLLLDLFRQEPDPGIHAATEWTLRRWNQLESLREEERQLVETETSLVTRLPDSDRRWFVNSEGHTFAIIDATVAIMGSPEAELGREEDEPVHTRTIDRRFAIATKEVTRQQFARFRRQLESDVESPQHPETFVLWYDAVAYCNWLSRVESIPEDQWCYRPNEQGEYADGMHLAPDYLSRTGYRLPTEAEWEFACRAGTTTARYFGDSEELMPHYAWGHITSNDWTWPVGTLKPNDWGLFDVLGNVHEWCQERYVPYPSVPDRDQEDNEVVHDDEARCIRGGGYNNRSRSLRSASRDP